MATMTVSTKSSPAITAGKISKTTGYYAAFVALGLTGASLGPTLPGLAEHTQTLLSEISFLFTARALGYLLGSFQGGRLYDRLPGHPLMAVTLLIMVTMMALAPLMSLLWLLTAVLLVVGIAEGTLDVGGNTLLVWVHGDEVGPFMNGLHFFFGVGSFLAPIIVAQAVLMSGDITWAYGVLALLMLPVAIWLLRLDSPVIPVVTKNSSAALTNHPLVVLVALFLFLYVGAEVSFGGWIFTYATALGLASATNAAYLTSAFWGGLTAGRLLAMPIATRLRPRFILLADLGGAMVSLGLILLWSDSLIAAWLGTLGVGLSMASIFPTTLSLAERRMTITGRVTGWFFVGASAGGMFLPWLIGQLFESIGPRVAMSIILADLVVAVGVFAALILNSTRINSSTGQDRTNYSRPEITP
jgi:FHS family Na+ dependent glucose MFS transporter 1